MKQILLILLVAILTVGTLFASEVTIGAGSQQARIPMDMYYQNSLFECIYLSTELNITSGTLTGISFYNNFTTNIGPKPTKIWLGTTTNANLSAGWIASGSLTQVFDGNVTYPSGANTILINLTTPFVYTGGNLVMMVNRPMDTTYYSTGELFYSQTVGNNRARKSRSDTVTYDPANPPTGSTLSGQFPKTTFTYSVDNMGALNGTIYGPGSVLLPGALVTVTGTTLSYATTATGTYSFPYVTIGDKQVMVTKHGYVDAAQTVTITNGGTTTQNFTLEQLPQVTLSGRIVGSDAPDAGIVGASISITGYDPYSATSGTGGYFSIAGVYANHVYNYTAIAPGYQNAIGQAEVNESDLDLGSIVVNEIASPPVNVIAAEASDFNSSNLTWSPPGTFTGTWIHYDSGTNSNSIGTGGNADFSIAVRYPASALAAYAGTSLQAVKCWPASTGTFSIRVWTGGTSTAPGTMVVDQTFTPALASYNTVLLNSPVLITGTEELWFGLRCVVTTGYPAGCDAGPQTEGFGNMIYFNNAWTSLTALAPTLTYNWNLQGYVGYSAPAKVDDSQLQSSVFAESDVSDRSMQGYKVWRLLQGQETNEATWTSLTPTAITGTAFTDNSWFPQPVGVYKYAVKAAYTNNVYSIAAFSNTIEKGMMGMLSGVVTDFGAGTPIEGATVIAGAYSGTTNASGTYTFPVYQGTYTVTCTKTGYNNFSQIGVAVVGSQLTTLNIPLYEITLPVTHLNVAETADAGSVNLSWDPAGSSSDSFTDGFESYTDFALEFSPWTVVDVDGSATYGYTGTTWLNSGAAQAYIIMDPSATTPAITTMPTHTGAKMATCVAATIPPNNDWLITPLFTPGYGDVISFWAKTHVATYGLERFYIGISTTGTNPADFTVISGPNYVETPVNWTQYTYDLSAYTGQDINIGIHCVSNDAWFFFVDDVFLGAPAKQNSYPEVAYIRDTTLRQPGLLFCKAPQSITPTVPQGTEPDRTLLGYNVWRFVSGNEANEAAWELLTADPVSATVYTDTSWGYAAEGTYRWAVKTAYPGGLLSSAKLSAPLTRAPHTDIAAVLIGGDTAPQTGVPAIYTVDVQNFGNTILPGSSYAVKLMNGTVELGSQPGVDLAPGETHGFPLVWTPTDPGGVIISGLVIMQGDTVPTNNETDGLEVVVGDTGLPVVLSSFTALLTATNYVQLSWITQSESGMIGYRVYRADSADQSASVQITDIIIPATNTSTAHSYVIADAEVSIGETYYYWLESVDYNQSSFHGPVSVTVVGEVPPVLPEITTLRNAYPNPFRTNASASIEVGIKSGENGLVTIYNVHGQVVKTYSVSEGYHILTWNGRDANGNTCGSGIYFYRLSSPSVTQTRKLVLTK